MPTKLGLVKNIKNGYELNKYLTLSLDKNHNLWRSQQRNFKNNIPYLDSATKKTLNIASHSGNSSFFEINILYL
mgnify:CR=1 FL=1